MKAISIITAAVFAASFANGQRLDSAIIRKLSLEDRQEVNNYISEGRKARTTGVVLSITGGALMVGGALLAVSSNDFIIWGEPTNNDSRDEIGGAMMVAGIVAELVSIPCYIKTHRQLNKARAIIYSDKNVMLTPSISMPGTQSAGVRLVVPLGK